MVEVVRPVECSRFHAIVNGLLENGILRAIESIEPFYVDPLFQVIPPQRWIGCLLRQVVRQKQFVEFGERLEQERGALRIIRCHSVRRHQGTMNCVAAFVDDHRKILKRAIEVSDKQDARAS